MNLSRPLSVVTPTVDGDVLAALASVETSFSGRELHRIIGRHSQSGVNRVLNRLVREGIVSRIRVGSARSYSLNREHLQAEAIILLARARERLIERLSDHIAEWEDAPYFAAMYGSSVGGGHGDESDVDLIVVRPETLDEDDEPWSTQLTELRSAVGRWTGNDCDLIEYSMEEVEEAFADRDPFIVGIGSRMVLLHGSRTYLHRPVRRRPRRAAHA